MTLPDNVKGQRGVALVVVLWVLVLLSIAALSVVGMSRDDALLARNSLSRLKLEAAADAGVNCAILMLLDVRSDHRWRLDATPNSIVCAGARVTVSVQDERGKIDINTATTELLSGLFRSVGLASDEADTIADRIADWRDRDTFRRLNGAESLEYQAAGYEYGPRNGPFQSVEEVQLVMGVTANLFQRIEPAITIYSGASTINPLVAPKSALLGLRGMTAESADELIAKRQRGFGKPSSAAAAMVEETLYGHSLSIRSEANLTGLGKFVRLAIVQPTGNDRNPFRIAEWREERLYGAP